MKNLLKQYKTENFRQEKDEKDQIKYEKTVSSCLDLAAENGIIKNCCKCGEEISLSESFWGNGKCLICEEKAEKAWKTKEKIQKERQKKENKKRKEEYRKSNAIYGSQG